jgi:site-specific DNA recombinase
MKKAALYARFSSDLQKDRSIDDQFAACQAVVKRENLKVVAKFADRAKSGASMFERDGLRDLMIAAKAKEFDVVVVEGLDRMSRDQADMAGIFKRLKFWDVEVLTLHEGIATDLHVGIRGIVSSLFLKDLAHKVKRGADGRAREGKIPGSLAYGYNCVLGKPGEREINADEAGVVRRIFREYAAGASPRVIAAGLSRDLIQSPNGTAIWNMQAVVNSGNNSKRGIINNRLYIGELVWNSFRQIKNPDTGRATIRRAPEAGIIRTPVPHLRIVEDALWDAAQKVREERSNPRRGGKRKVVPRKDTLLVGLLRCETCGGHMRIRGKDADGSPRVGCAAADANNSCHNTRSYHLGQLEATVISGLRDMLMDPKHFARFEKGLWDQYKKRSRTDNSDLHAVQKKLDQVSVQIDRVVNVIATMNTPVKELADKLDSLEGERAGLAERVRLLQAEGNVVHLHPNALKAYRDNLIRLLGSLKGTATTPEHHAAFRMLFDSIIVHKTAKRMPYEVTPYARVGGTLDANLSPPRRSSAQVLEEAGVSHCDNAAIPNPKAAISQCDNAAKASTKAAISQQVICLGRWRKAA